MVQTNLVQTNLPAPHHTPLVRVVIPAFRAERTIRQCVLAIMNSKFSASYEIVVADDGGHDDLVGVLQGLAVTIVSTGTSGSAAVARNLGAQGFAGRYLIFIDADVIVEPHCLESLLAPLASGRADATVGNYSRDVDGLSFASRYKQLYIACVYGRQHGYLNEFWTAIGAIDARLFCAFGGFDTCFEGAAGEDVDLGCRLSENGYRILAVTDAVGQHRHDLTLGRLVLNDWRKGLVTLEHYHRSGSSPSRNRHATKRDKAAVVLAVSTLGLPFLMLLAGTGIAPPILVPVISAAAYLVVRSDILASFLPRGVGFAISSAGVMAFLDLVRCVCVITAIALHARRLIHERPRHAMADMQRSEID